MILLDHDSLSISYGHRNSPPKVQDIFHNIIVSHNSTNTNHIPMQYKSHQNIRMD